MLIHTVVVTQSTNLDKSCTCMGGQLNVDETSGQIQLHVDGHVQWIDRIRMLGGHGATLRLCSDSHSSVQGRHSSRK